MPIAKKFSDEYDEGYKLLRQNPDDYKALDKMESAKYWGAKFKEKIREIEKMTEENEAHGKQLAWLTNMYYNSPEPDREKYSKWAGELREEHERELNSISGNPDIDRFLEIALKEVGTKEIGNNSTKYGDWYYNRKVSGAQYPWCATFVSWCANEAGMLGNTIGKYEGCWQGIDYYKKSERYYTANSGYLPKAGDVFFHGTEHTGIILAYIPEEYIAYTIEGNADNEVKVLKRPLSYFTSFGSNGGTKQGKIPTTVGETTGQTQ